MGRLQDRISVRKGGWSLGLKETPLHQSLEQVTSPQEPGPGEPTPPQRPTWGKRSLHTHPVPRARDVPGEQAQDDSPQTLGLRVAGTPAPPCPPPTVSFLSPPATQTFPPVARTQTQVWTHLMEDNENRETLPWALGWGGMGWPRRVTEEGGIPAPQQSPGSLGSLPPLPFPPTAFQALHPRTSHRGEDTHTHTLGSAKAHTVTQGVERSVTCSRVSRHMDISGSACLPQPEKRTCAKPATQSTLTPMHPCASRTAAHGLG